MWRMIAAALSLTAAGAFAAEPPFEPVKHNVYQWDRVFTNNDLYKGGWAGQGLLVNPDRDLVAVWVGYFKDDAHSETDLLRPLRALLEEVFGR